MIEKSKILSLVLAGFLVSCCSVFGQAKKYVSLGSSDESIKQIVVESRGEHIAAITVTNELQCWNTSTRNLFKSISIDNATASMSLSADDLTLACGTTSGKIQLRAFPSLELKATLDTKHQAPVLKTVWANPDSLVVLFEDNTIQLYSLKTSSQIYALSASEFPATSLDVSDSLNLMVVSDTKGTLYIRNLSTGQLIRKVAGHRKLVREVLFDEERLSIASVGDDGNCNMIGISSDYNFFKRKIFFSWLTAIDLYQKSILLASREGYVEVITPFNSYEIKINAVITSARFIPQTTSNQLIFCLGTLGKGLVVVEAVKMKSRDKLRAPQPQASRAFFYR